LDQIDGYTIRRAELVAIAGSRYGKSDPRRTVTAAELMPAGSDLHAARVAAYLHIGIRINRLRIGKPFPHHESRAGSDNSETSHDRSYYTDIYQL
jgi:hypothetical protein